MEKLPGPKSNSFIFGTSTSVCLPDGLTLARKLARPCPESDWKGRQVDNSYQCVDLYTQTDFEWFREYGNVFKATAPLGVCTLLNPALCHINV